MTHVLTIVKCLLIHPNPESALNEEAGKLLLEQYDDYAKHARMMTDIHAKVKCEPAEPDDDSVCGHREWYRLMLTVHAQSKPRTSGSGQAAAADKALAAKKKAPAADAKRNLKRL